MITTATTKAPKPLTLQTIRPGSYKSSDGRFEVSAAPSTNRPQASTKVQTGPTSPIFHQPVEGATTQRTQQSNGGITTSKAGRAVPIPDPHSANE